MKVKGELGVKERQMKGKEGIQEQGSQWLEGRKVKMGRRKRAEAMKDKGEDKEKNRE